MIVPDAIEPIVGWRCWSLNDAGQLESLLEGTDPWLPNQRQEAKCLSPLFSMPGETSDTEYAGLDPALGDADFLKEHQAPLESCSCGIYAARDLETLRISLSSGPIIGEVYLWGKIIPGENGYRAQYAYPKSLRLVADHVVGPELRQLRAYCSDVGVMTRSEAWGPWPKRVLRYGRLLVTAPLDPHRWAGGALILAVWAYKTFLG
jgi:hypothetical protein